MFEAKKLAFALSLVPEDQGGDNEIDMSGNDLSGSDLCGNDSSGNIITDDDLMY